MSNISQFINDFKKSPIFKDIINDSKVEVMMLWVSGSVLTGADDSESDYDVCILVKETPKDNPKSPWTIYGRPGSYFMWYKPHSKKVEWIYTDINDIISPSTVTPLVNSGWAQFKYVTKDAVIYINPKYEKFINYLFEHNEEIYNSSLYLFIHSALYHTINNQLIDLIKEDPSRPNKILAHICLVADLLQGNEMQSEKLLLIKRNLYSELSDQIKEYINSSIDYLESVKNIEIQLLDLWTVLKDKTVE